jgi:hypothetical protein
VKFVTASIGFTVSLFFATGPVTLSSTRAARHWRRRRSCGATSGATAICSSRAFSNDGIDAFEDRSSERNGGFCFYNRSVLVFLVEDCGWTIVSSAPGEGPLIGDSFVCRPARPTSP